MIGGVNILTEYIDLPEGYTLSENAFGDTKISNLIPLAEYAKMHGKEESSVRKMALRGGFKTARKIGRNWVIDKNEPYIDRRKKQSSD